MFNLKSIKNKKNILFNKKFKIEKLNFKEFLLELNNNFVIENYKNEIIRLKNEYLIAKAEVENQKKISSNEINKISKFAIENFSEDLLNVLDSLESAMKVKLIDNEKILEGIRLTLKLLINALEKNKIQYILPKINDEFDPHKHLAISTLNLNNFKDNAIINVLQKGYFIFDRILRPALVVVNKVN